MSRTTARAAAMQMIFEKISGGQGGEDTLKMVYDELREDGLPGVTMISRKEPALTQGSKTGGSARGRSAKCSIT